LTIDASEYGLTGVVHTAGTPVPPGRYRRLGGWGRVLELPEGGVLPPSFDGQIALYVPLAPTAAPEMAR
jgi:hypothetical protein